MGKWENMLAVAIAKDAIDALVNLGYLVSVGTLTVAGVPLLFILDLLVAGVLYIFSRNILVFAFAIPEAIPALQVIPTWTLFVIAMRKKMV